MWKYIVEDHEVDSDKNDFSIKIIRVLKNLMTRQLIEACRIHGKI